MDDQVRLLVLSELRDYLRSRGARIQSERTTLEADCLDWALAKIAENSRRVALAFEAFDNGAYCENCKGSTENAMARALQGKGDDE